MNYYKGLYGYMGAKGRDAISYVQLMARKNSTGQAIERFIDGCFGAGNITSATAGLYEERIANDYDETIAFLATMVANPDSREKTLDYYYQLEAGEDTFNKVKTSLEKSIFSNDYEKAAYIWYLFLFSYDGMRNHYSHKHDFAKNPMDCRLPYLETFDKIVVTEQDIVTLIENEKKNRNRLEKTMVFLDPPYLGNQCGYKNNMSKEFDQTRLLKALDGIPYCMICNFDNELYDSILVNKYHWYKYNMSEKAVVMGKKKSGFAERKPEVIWTSYDVFKTI